MAFHTTKAKRAVLLSVGIVLGIVLTRLLPLAPLHASATDRQDTLAIATVEVEPGIEAVFMLDFLSGDMRAGILNPETHTFTATYFRNIVADLKVEIGKTPRYLMVTGGAYMRTKSNWRLAPCAVYVVELTSGKMAAYGFAYNSSFLSRPSMLPPMELLLMDVVPIRTTAIRAP
jgi:hypothetical protein